MKIIDTIKPVLPHLAAVILFTLLSFVFFYPVLEGKVLKANDSTVSNINSREIRDFREKFHREPLWTNSIFSGMPAYLISSKYPGNLIKHADTVIRIFKMPVSVLFVSMAGFYLMLLIFGINPWLALGGAIGFGFSSFFFQILAAGHNTQAIALAYMAPLIGGIYYAYRHDAVRGALMTAFFLSLQILANHLQITYYVLIIVLIFILSELIYSLKNKSFPAFLKTSLILLVPVIIATGVNYGSLSTIREYGKYSIRGKSDLQSEHKNFSQGLDRDYIVYWSYGIGETFNLLIPNFKGGSSRPFDTDSETVRALRQNNAGDAVNQVMKYWGTQPGTDGPHYMGAVIIFLFILGLVVVKGQDKWWLLIASLLSIMLAWGKNFMPLTNLFIDFFPGYNKFRAVTMTLVIAQFCIPLLGFLALREIYQGKLSKKEAINGIKMAGAITAGILIIALLIPGIAGSFLNDYESDYPAWLTSVLVSDRKELLRADALRSLIFFIAAALTIIGYLTGRLKKEYSFLLIGCLILFDLWGAGKRYLGADRFERPSVIQKSFAPTVADAEILKDNSYFRVLNLSVSTFNDNSPTSWFHKSVGGYHGAKLKRYQELIDSCLSRDLSVFSSAKTIEDLQTAFDRTPVLNMLNAKYLIWNPGAAPVLNPQAMGNAWFVEKPVIAGNANDELATVRRINPAKEAVIDKKFGSLITRTDYPLSDNDRIELISYQPNELEYSYTAEGEKLAVFSEIYYPAGWKCYIDGKETSHFRVNYVLRGMILQEGTHKVKFSFDPATYSNGNKVSLASSILLILLITGYFVFAVVKRPKSQ